MAIAVLGYWKACRVRDKMNKRERKASA